MSRWTCAACGRTFGRRNQSHTCAPGTTVAEWFAARPHLPRDVLDAVVAVLDDVADESGFDVEAVEVGILVKRSRTFAELRPRRDHLVLSVLLSRPLAHPRIHRTIHISEHRSAYFVALHAGDDVDGDVASWLAESYLDSPV